LEDLRALAEVINQAVGDALSDMLLVEAVLTCQGKTLAEWDSDYTDLPSRQEKVKVQFFYLLLRMGSRCACRCEWLRWRLLIS
jgi:hypothetical protein